MLPKTDHFLENYPSIIQPRPLSPSLDMEQDPGFIAAVEEAKKGAEEGGVPIGACLVSKDGKILGRGHNMRVQKGSTTLHVGLSLFSLPWQ